MPPYNTELSGIGSFVPTTNVWEITQIYENKEFSESQKEILVRLYQNINDIALVINTKKTEMYPINEMNTSGLMFGTTATNFEMRGIFSATINFGALPNATSKPVAHNIYFPANSTVKFIAHQCWATNPTTAQAISIPYADTSAIANNVSINVTTNNINIATGIDRSDFTECIVTLYYIKI